MRDFRLPHGIPRNMTEFQTSLERTCTNFAVEALPNMYEIRLKASGTYPYMSIAVLRNNYDHDLAVRQYRDHLDDLESVFYLFCEVVFFWDKACAPLWYDSEDLYECAAAKLLMFCVEPEEFDTGGIDKSFGEVTCRLLKRFFSFIQKFVVLKEEINVMGDREAEERARLALINSWEEHFEVLLDIFDDALEELGILPFDDVDSASTPPSPTRTLAERLDGLTLTWHSRSKKSRL
ncbi:hypothetical protein NMY22_g19759 [Coprinellus aureogranulatus]|nr:hypothetical protein NMY22_g19759 [Coprinellus aureogranulatus]